MCVCVRACVCVLCVCVFSSGNSFFKKDPVPFYELVKELIPKDLSPSLTHYFLKLLEKKQVLRRVYT